MNIHVVGIPFELGAGRRGVELGPAALRHAKLNKRLAELGHSVHDEGDVAALPPEQDRYEYPGSGAQFRDEVLAANRAVCEKIKKLPAEDVVLSLGGDHSLAIGTVAGNALRGSEQGHRMGVVWIDAHADFNTPEVSPSGNIHGMSVALLCGLGDDKELASVGGEWRLDPADVVMIGLRSVDEGEARLLREHGVKLFTMKDIDELGISEVMKQTLAHLEHTDKLHVSFDADSLDPSLTPGTGTPVAGGLTLREGHLLMELFNRSGRVTSMDIVEVNPLIDHNNKTARTMVEMAASMFGLDIMGEGKR